MKESVVITGGQGSMNYSGVALRLREKIHEFSGKLSSHFSKPTRLFLEQMLYGIQTSREVKLSEIARSLGEDISLRFSRNLMKGDLEERLLCEIA